MYFFDNRPDYAGQPMLITDQGGVLSYQQVSELEDQMLAQVRPRSLVFLLCRNHPDCIAAYLGFLRKGSVSLLLDEAIHPSLLRELLEIYRPNLLFFPVSRIGELPNGSHILWSDSCFLLASLSAEAPAMHPDLALLLSTSGSTGSPKLVRLSRENLQANAASIAEYLELTAGERPITSLPMSYTYGLSVLNSHFLKGAAVLVTDRSYVEQEFWSFFQREQATSLSGVPYSYQIWKRLRLETMQLPSLRAMTQAGGRLSPELQTFFGSYAEERGIRFYVMYGQTEATARMSWLPPADCLKKPGSIGLPIPGGSFALLAEDGSRITEPDTDGELLYYGRNVSLGYAECCKDLQRGDENHGCLHTGDLARRDADGYYRITGRLRRFLKIAGKRLNLDMLEQFLKAQWPAEEFVCTGTDDLVQICVVQRPGQPEELEEALCLFLSERTGIHASAFTAARISAIPRNAAGKILYQNLKLPI